MNNSYKYALMGAALLCVVMIAYYVIRGGDAEPTSSPSTEEVAVAPTPLTEPSRTRPEPSRTPSTPAPPRSDLSSQVYDFMRNDDPLPPAVPTTPPPTPRLRETAPSAAPTSAPESAPRRLPADVEFGPQPTERSATATEPEAAPSVAPPPIVIQPSPAASPARDTAPTATAPRSAPTQAQTYTVKEGDTFSSIAAELSRRHNRNVTWVHVAQANPTMDPDRIRPGQVIRLPSPDAPVSTAPPSTSTAAGTTSDGRPIYVVRPNDSLAAIARQYYGDETKWPIIYEANRETIGANPDRVRDGMRLVIPPAPSPAR